MSNIAITGLSHPKTVRSVENVINDKKERVGRLLRQSSDLTEYRNNKNPTNPNQQIGGRGGSSLSFSTIK